MSNPSWRRVFGMSARTLVFSQLLLEAIDDSLSILGDEPKKALYQYLATMHSLQREEIPDRLEEFSAGLKRALGGASSVIQRIILRKLFQKLGSTFRESQDSEFPDYIRDARRRFDSAKQRHNLPDDSMEFVRSKKSQLSG